MQANQDEGDRSSPHPEAAASDGLEQAPGKVVKWGVISPGRDLPHAFCIDPVLTTVSSKTSDGTPFTWDRWNISEVRLNQTTSLLILQGMPLKTVFTNAVIADGENNTVRIYSGPFIFLKGQFHPESPIPAITGVVLGRLHEGASRLPEQEVFGSMVQVVLSP